MKITVKEDPEFISHSAIILSDKDENQAKYSELSAYLGKKEQVFIEGIGEFKMILRTSDDPEKLRKRGAECRKRLDREVTQFSVVGSPNDTFHFLEGFMLASYQFLKYFKNKDERAFLLEEVVVAEAFSNEHAQELESIRKAVWWARDMVNEPVSFLNAEQLAAELVGLGKDSPLSIKVLEKGQIEALKMGGLLAVNQGSVDPPTFTIMEYKGANPKNSKPIVLVGKGVVYDTGGLSLKPTPNSMDIMKSDMGGAACMAGAIYLAALQKLPLHIVALIPATDNRPGLNAYAPGDVVTMYDGTTVEVLNTDAEGRMILADALAYAEKFDPELVMDAATLTGAAVRAVGVHASAVMGNADEKYFTALEAAGEASYERMVRFPFWEEYGEEMKSSIADLKNIGGPNAGMITAGKFLEHFVKAPYIHLDIAGPAWMDSASDYKTKGGTGAGVRLLYHFLKNYA